MGMFDDLKCDYPLPNAVHQNRAFQTKSLDCTMTQYTITADGRLTYPQMKDVKDDKAPLGWHFMPTGHIIDTVYHGDIYFYAGDAEYVARFTNGKAEWIKPLSEVD